MNRAFQYINLFGVLALSVLCVVQWQRDRRLHLELNRLEKTRLAQEQQLVEQEKSMRGLTRDLDMFKEQFTSTQTNLVSARQGLESARSEKTDLENERNQLKASLSNWQNAVTLRDQRLADAQKDLRHLADKANESVQKYNELATNYNRVVEQLNLARKQAAPADQQ